MKINKEDVTGMLLGEIMTLQASYPSLYCYPTRYNTAVAVVVKLTEILKRIQDMKALPEETSWKPEIRWLEDLYPRQQYTSKHGAIIAIEPQRSLTADDGTVVWQVGVYETPKET